LFEEDISEQRKYFFRREKYSFNQNRITIGLALLENKICSTQIDSRIARKRNRNRLRKLWKRLRYTICRYKCSLIDNDSRRDKVNNFSWH
jgi:hypothetical protein